jgi:hypothetical protein
MIYKTNLITNNKIEKTVNFLTYDYPFIGNDIYFIEPEVENLSKIFRKVNIIPLKKNDKISNKFLNYDNINFDYRLSKINIYYVFFEIIKSFFSLTLWIEIFKIRRKFLLKKIKMIFSEYVNSKIIEHFIRKNYDLNNEIFYSFWSNCTLISLQKLNVKNSFSRSLGSDLNGFVAEDDFVPFIRNKFNNLNFLLILNDGQKKLLRNKNLIIKNKIHKCYLGTEIQNHYNVGNSKKEITFLSCGSLIDIKNPLFIANFINKFSDFYKNIKINYISIGTGHLESKFKEKFIKKKSNLKFTLIPKVNNIFNFIKKNRIDYFINFSFSEGLSFANMEVMSVGIPVICSNIYGNTEIVNKANGFIHNSNEDLNFSKISKSILNNHLNIKKKNKKRNLAQLTILKKFDLKICQSDFNKIIYRYYI